MAYSFPIPVRDPKSRVTRGFKYREAAFRLLGIIIITE